MKSVKMRHVTSRAGIPGAVVSGVLAAAVLCAPSTSQAQPLACNQNAKLAFDVGTEILGLVPGAGEVAGVLKIAGLLGSSLGASKCGPSPLTMREVRKEIERITANRISQQVIGEIETQTIGFRDEFEQTYRDFDTWLKQGNLEDQAQRSRLADKFEDIAFDAGRIERMTRDQRFQVLPIFVQLSSLKIGALLTAHELAAPNERGRMKEKLAAARAESVALLKSIKGQVGSELKMRLAAEAKTGKRGARKVHVKVSDEARTIFEKKSSCSKIIPGRCNKRWRRSLRSLFGQAKKKFSDQRERRLQIIDREFLAFQNALMDKKRPAFQVHAGFNEAHPRSKFSFRRSKDCLVAAADGKIRTGACVPAADLNGGNAAHQRSLWAILPTTGQLYNLHLKACLQPRQNKLVTAPCAQGKAAKAQSWGIHPAGYLIHLGSENEDRCIGSTSRINIATQTNTDSGTLANRTAEVVLSKCNFRTLGFKGGRSYDLRLSIHGNAGNPSRSDRRASPKDFNTQTWGFESTTIDW